MPRPSPTSKFAIGILPVSVERNPRGVRAQNCRKCHEPKVTEVGSYGKGERNSQRFLAKCNFPQRRLTASQIAQPSQERRHLGDDRAQIRVCKVVSICEFHL